MNKNKWFLNGGRGSGRSIRLLCETYENKIAELEKENAELKESLKKWKDAIYADVENYDKQFTKAKEILKAVVDFYPTMTATILLEAEQFLKDSEVEK